MGPIDPRALLPAAAVVAVAVAPLALLAAAADEDGPLRSALFLAQLAVFVGGGALAARRAPVSPVVHAAAAAALGWAIVQVVAIVVRVLAGEDVAWGALPFLALFAATTGTVGGVVVTWRRMRHTTDRR